jgi:hypothetical protein
MIIEEVLRVSWNSHPWGELNKRREHQPAGHVTLSPALAGGAFSCRLFGFAQTRLSPPC